jgi:cobalt-zinc-cadmium efflux system membrane fusion protein
VAPFDGVVIGRDVGLGEVVEPAKPLFQICDVRNMWVNLQVQKEDAPKMSIGQEVVVRVDGMRGELQSRISWISTEVNEETRTLQVRAEIENPIARADEPSAAGQRLLRANTFVTAAIRIRTSPNAIVVPSECVHADVQEHLVFVQTGARTFEGRRVRRGITAGGRTELIGDLAPGELVACRGSHLLKSQILLSRSDSQGHQ